jgi:hypothetical protein
MARVVEVIGDKKLKRQLRREAKKNAEGVSRGLLKGGLYLQAEAQEIVPIDTAALKNSARTQYDTKFPGSRQRDAKGRFMKAVPLAVAVTFETAYAVFVHEDLYARHKSGKTAKYLEKPANEKRREIAQVIFDEARR